jgi:hypothetical protein
MKRAAVLALLFVVAPRGAHANDEDYGRGTVIFARGASLYRVDARGRSEVEVASLGAKDRVRALRTDAKGSVLLVDIGGKWSWLPLDGSTKTPAELPCADGPASLSEDGLEVLCRAKTGAGSQLVNLKDGTAKALDVPPSVGARLVGAPADHHVIWTDKGGVWSAPVKNVKARAQLAADPPLRSFLVSPDGKRAVGVFADKVFTGVKTTKPAELLMGFALDTPPDPAHRKMIKTGVPIEWSHDGKWVLTQDGSAACLMMANGGQYKCWKGYTGASISPDGRWGLVLGNRDGSKKQTSAKPKKGAKPAPPPKDEEPTDEPEAEGDQAPIDDVEVAPPSGPLALYRVRLEGAFNDAPTLLVKIVDGAAVWLPGPALPQL